MPSFRYTAMTTAGEKVAGILAAGSEQAILAELETRRLVPVAVTPVKEKEAAGRRWSVGKGGISPRRLATAYIQLADLLRAGVPLMRALRLLGARRSRPALAKVFADLADAVSEGKELAEAMSARPDVFERIHVTLVRAGEKGGFLEMVFTRLGRFLHAQADLRARVVGSLIYPCVLVSVGVLALGFIFGVIIPKFRDIFARIELNWLTRSVLALSNLVARDGLYMLAAAALIGFGLWWGARHPAMRRRLDVLRVKAPVIGPLTRSIGLARFCRVLGTLMNNAIPMISAMQIARDAVGNAPMEEAIDRATEAVRQGQPLAPPLAESGLFEDDAVEMIAVGESANNLDDVLITIADTVDGRIDRQLSAAVKLIEPLMLLLLASVIAIVALALVLPMTRMGSGIGR